MIGVPKEILVLYNGFDRYETYLHKTAEEMMNFAFRITTEPHEIALESLPDWNKAPVEASWWAVDCDGRANWFTGYKPFPDMSIGRWKGSPNCRWLETDIYHVDLPIGLDWRTTLYGRPGEDEA